MRRIIGSLARSTGFLLVCSLLITGGLALTPPGPGVARAQEVVDGDHDGVDDTEDNCTTVANAYQNDTDDDGFGNACDADYDGTLVVGLPDLGIFQLAMWTTETDDDYNADADHNGDGIVGLPDLNVLVSQLWGEPGPSSLPCAGTPVCLGNVDDDHDGVRRSHDNCVAAANASQMDVDHDGFGNACDPDYTQDGMVDLVDVSAFLAAFNTAEGEPGFDPTMDHDDDGFVGVEDWRILLRHLGGAPGPSPLGRSPALRDADLDGVADGGDNCLLVANNRQIDSSGDGIGNLCDPDYDDNGVVDELDAAVLQAAFGTSEGDPGFDPDVDHDGDGQIGMSDWDVLHRYLGGPPGASGIQ